MKTLQIPELPGLDCGVCGFRTCLEFKASLPAKPELLQRCIHLSGFSVRAQNPAAEPPPCA